MTQYYIIALSFNLNFTENVNIHYITSSCELSQYYEEQNKVIIDLKLNLKVENGVDLLS